MGTESKLNEKVYIELIPNGNRVAIEQKYSICLANKLAEKVFSFGNCEIIIPDQITLKFTRK